MCSKSFVFPNQVRKYYIYCGMLTIIGMLLFSTCMFIVGYKQQAEMHSYYFIGCFFAILGVYYVYVWISKLSLIRMTYIWEGSIISNQIGNKTIVVDLNQKGAEVVFPFTFSFGYSNMSINYRIIGNERDVKYVPETNNVYKSVRKLWSLGCVIVPITSNTEETE